MKVKRLSILEWEKSKPGHNLSCFIRELSDSRRTFYFCKMLQANNLTYAYAGHEALSFPDIDCQRGEHWLILGDSGSGKTTLLHLLGGLLRPKGGQIDIADTDVTRLGTAALDRFRGKHIGIIFSVPILSRPFQ